MGSVKKFFSPPKVDNSAQILAQQAQERAQRLADAQANARKAREELANRRRGNDGLGEAGASGAAIPNDDPLAAPETGLQQGNNLLTTAPEGSIFSELSNLNPV